MASSESSTSVELMPVDEEMSKLIEMFTGEAEFELPKTDPQAVTRDILTQILSAETEEELWAELPTWSTKDHVGSSFLIEGGNIYPSKFTNPDTGVKGAFLSARAVNLETGERGVLNTSAARVAGKLLWLARHDALPAQVQVVARGKSAAGYDILDIVKLES